MKHIKTIHKPPHIIYVYSYDDQFALLVKDYNGVLLESAYGYESQEDAEREVQDKFVE